MKHDGGQVIAAGPGVEEFDVEVADAAEDLVVWVGGEVVLDAGFPFALGREG